MEKQLLNQQKLRARDRVLGGCVPGRPAGAPLRRVVRCPLTRCSRAKMYQALFSVGSKVIRNTLCARMEGETYQNSSRLNPVQIAQRQGITARHAVSLTSR